MISVWHSSCTLAASAIQKRHLGQHLRSCGREAMGSASVVDARAALQCFAWRWGCGGYRPICTQQSYRWISICAWLYKSRTWRARFVRQSRYMTPRSLNISPRLPFNKCTAVTPMLSLKSIYTLRSSISLDFPSSECTYNTLIKVRMGW